MPKYLNSTSEVKVIDLTILPPGVVTATYVYLTPLPAGVTLVDDEPSINPILHSLAYTATTTVPVPTVDGAYFLEIYVESGEWTVQFNHAAMTPVLKLTEGMNWSRKLFARTINSIIMTRTTPGGRIWLNIERG